MGGFTPAGAPKEVPSAIAAMAEALHAEGKPYKIGMYTGASTGDSCDGALARAHAIEFRTPYQVAKTSALSSTHKVLTTSICTLANSHKTFATALCKNLTSLL